MNIFITGAGKGIGQAIVHKLVTCQKQFDKPLKLFITSRSEEDLISISQFAKNNHIECHYFAKDLAKDSTFAFQEALKICPDMDAVIHNAGVGVFKDFLSITEADYDFVMETNAKASFFLMQKVYAYFKSKSQGQIQWITSVAADKPFEQSSLYCMSKYAQQGLLDVMRLYAYQDRIKILEIKPGATLTPMWGAVSQEQAPKMLLANDIADVSVNALLMRDNASIESVTVRPISGDL